MRTNRGLSIEITDEGKEIIREVIVGCIKIAIAVFITDGKEASLADLIKID